MSSRHRAAYCEPLPVGGSRLSLSDSRKRDFCEVPQARLHIFPKMRPLEAAPSMRSVLWGAWILAVRLPYCLDSRLRESAPCKGEIPGVQNEVLCGGCISLSNAEGLGKGLRPPRKLPADTPWTPSELPPEQAFSGHKKAACLKSDISVPKQTATITPLFAAFRLLFFLILRA